MRRANPRHRLAGRYRGVPLDQATDGQVRGQLMLKYRGSRLAKPGFIGVVLIVLCIAVGLRPEQLASWATSLRYQALFTQVGGLAAGNDVTVSGIKVGTVTDVALDDGQALVNFTIKCTVRLGNSTTAHIRTGSLLGQRMLTLESAGRGRLRPSD